ncbi:hypothetical protein SH1V18_03080 [Vallitalea longa]|uniref:Uncharacterized protein n=1 Tax=Vallitalea longa TaxID=2936439 RepID=A0A9W6DDY9_9FIRM|nr:DUF5721 family protein [Vallitalea longa]GKX27828.1 hypothetical protein SH1V18_03080 [Vallitalea longa]
MVCFNIIDIKLFMNNLLKDKMFDDFEVSTVELNTFTKFNISCDINKKYLSTNEIEILEGRDQVKWSEIKNIVFYMIKGNKTPSYLKIVFSLPHDKIENMISKHQLPTKSDNVNGLFINILYEDNVLKCTTGSSMKIFTLDKTLENYWDDSVKIFFKKHGITV